MTAAPQSPDEVFDVCDADDRVIGQAPRAVVHAQRLLHRAVHVFLFNSQRQLLVQVRSALKDEYPLCLTSSASGHLGTGEDYLESAHRELEEEIGLRAALTFQVKLAAGEQLAWEHTVLYEAFSDEPPVPDPQEVAELRWYTISELLVLDREQPALFSPPFRVLVHWYAGRPDA